MPEGELKPQRRVLIALCRPLLFGAGLSSASNRRFADEVSLTEDAIKKHLGVLFTHFGVKAADAQRQALTAGADRPAARAS